MDFQNLFSPIQINGLMVKNRIVATPTGDYFDEKALGGAGIVVTGHAIVEDGRSSFASGEEPDAFAKYEREATRRRVLKVHQGGAKASIEIFHGGLQARVRDFARGPVSLIRKDGVPVRGMSAADMALVSELYAQQVCEARDLGFDLVLLHFGHGWLPAQFLSPRTNSRDDEYGGSLENRARFPLQILRTIREVVGPSFPIDMRISAVEWMPGSIEFEDTLRFIELAQEYLDAVQISAGVDIGIEGNVHCVPTTFEQHMPNVEWARRVREAVKIPVGVVGAILAPEEAQDIIASGKADLVGLGRPLIADPEWPKKAATGRAAEIVPCIRCMQCYHIATERRKVGCSVNPRFANEEFVPRRVEPASTRRRVVVVGGGPAGITAALVASQRGHTVTLLERGTELGGLLSVIRRERFKQDIARYHDYLLGRLRECPDIDICLSTEATPETVAALHPDSLILALGADEFVPPVTGVDGERVMLATAAIEQPQKVGQRVVVLGAGPVGAELALELAMFEGRSVTVVEPDDMIARQGNSLYREGLRQKIEQCQDLEFKLGCRPLTIGADGTVQAQSTAGDRYDFPADTVIVATGMRARGDEAKRYFGIVTDTVMVGDCVQPRIIQDAVLEAHTFAMNL